MDKTEYQLKLNELTQCVQNREYAAALKIVEEIDWKRVKSIRTLSMVADIYEVNRDYRNCKRILLLAYEKTTIGKNLLFRLTEISLKLKEIEDAQEYYKQFLQVAPNDNARHLLNYKLLKATEAPLEERIRVLETYKDYEYTERWAYELAELYHKAGMAKECVDACDDMILWFSEGRYVLKAMELKKQYENLAPYQQRLYEKAVTEKEPEKETPNIVLPVATKAAVEANFAKAEHVDSKAVLQKMDEASAAITKDMIVDNREQAMPITDAAMDRYSVTSKEFIGKTANLSLELEKSIKNVFSDQEKKPEPYIVEELVTETVQKEVNMSGGTIAEELAEIALGKTVEETVEAAVEEVTEAAVAAEDTVTVEEVVETAEEVEEVTEDTVTAEEAEVEEVAEAAEEVAETAGETEAVEEVAEAAEETEAVEEVAETAEETEAAEEVAETAGETEVAEEVAETAEETETAEEVAETAEETEAAEEVAETAEETDTVEKAVDAAFRELDADVEEITEGASSLMIEELFSEDSAEELAEEEVIAATEETVAEEEVVEAAEETVAEEEVAEAAEETVAEEEVAEAAEETVAVEEVAEAAVETAVEAAEEVAEAAAETAAVAEAKPDRLSMYNLDLEIPDPEPTEEDRKSHTIPLSKLGQNTVPISIEDVLRQETPEERRIRILNDAKPTRMNDDQRKIFTYFARIPGMDRQILAALSGVYKYAGEHTSKRGNIAVMGARGTGKTRLTQGLLANMCKDMGLEAAKVARVKGYRMNRAEIAKLVQTMSGGFLIIEDAGEMTAETIAELNKAMEFRTDCMIVIMEAPKSEMRALLKEHPDFAEKFNTVINIPAFTNDELVTFARTYCAENDCQMDEMGVLALYTLISNNQSEEEPVTIADVKKMVDNAILRAKSGGKRFGRGRKNKNKLTILYEKDFDLV